MKYIYMSVFCVVIAFGDSEVVDFHTIDENFSPTIFNNEQKISVDEFIEYIEKNSTELAKSQAMTKSLVYEGKVARAWSSPYIDTEVSRVKSPSGGTELETTITFNIAPRLPWVSYALAQSYKNKILRQEKSYELTKRLALISAKRLYLSYLILKEQHQIYFNRYENAKNQLKVSQVQYEAGRISKSQYLFFKSDFLATQVALKISHTELIRTLNSLKVILGISTKQCDIVVENLTFEFLDFDTQALESALAQNLYLEMTSLDIKDYQYSASIASQSRFDAFEIGGGISKGETSDGVLLSVKIPFPLTTQYDNKKAIYLALQSGAIREGEILKVSIIGNAKSYVQQLQHKQELISLAKANEANKAQLSEIAKVSYESGKSSVFEYLRVKNDYLSAMIATTQAKQDYIQTLSMLEETLSAVLQLSPSTDANPHLTKETK